MNLCKRHEEWVLDPSGGCVACEIEGRALASVKFLGGLVEAQSRELSKKRELVEILSRSLADAARKKRGYTVNLLALEIIQITHCGESCAEYLFLSEANLSRADLSRANLSGAELSGAELYRADLSEANLSGAELYLANLSRADLSGANLSGANLSRADLSGANLSGAELSRADLSGANLSGANLRNS